MGTACFTLPQCPLIDYELGNVFHSLHHLWVDLFFLYPGFEDFTSHKRHNLTGDLLTDDFQTNFCEDINIAE